MRITVDVKTSSRKEGLEQMTQASLGLGDAPGDKVVYKISVKEAPVDGKANEAVTRILAEHFNVSKSRVHIILGHTYKRKVFEIDVEA